MIQLWFVSRALGLVALLLLSGVLALGVVHNTAISRRLGDVLPRFVLVALHRNLSLVAVVFTVLHVVAVVVTPYVDLRWLDVVVPGIARYNTVAAALGTVAFDLLVAIVVTSLLRRRVSRRVWFLVHWTAYLFSPVAVAHAVVNASVRGGTWWTLAVPVASLGVVATAGVYRWRDQRRGALPLGERGEVPSGAAERGGEQDRPAAGGSEREADTEPIVRPLDAPTRVLAPARGRHGATW